MKKLAAVGLISIALAGCGSSSDAPTATSSNSGAAIDNPAAIVATKEAAAKDAPALTALSGQFTNHGVVAKDALAPTATGAQISGATFGGFLAFSSTPGLNPLMVGSPVPSGAGNLLVGREYDNASTAVIEASSPDGATGAARRINNPVAHVVSGYYAGLTASGGITVGSQAILSMAPETAAQARTWRQARDANGVSFTVLSGASAAPVISPSQTIQIPTGAVGIVHSWYSADWKSAVILYLQEMQGAVNLCTYILTPDIASRTVCDIWYPYGSTWVFISHVVIDMTADLRGYFGWIADGTATQRVAVEGDVTIKGASGTDVAGQVVNGILKLRQP